MITLQSLTELAILFRMIANHCFRPSHFIFLDILFQKCKGTAHSRWWLNSKYSDFKIDQILVTILDELNMGYFEQLSANQKSPWGPCILGGVYPKLDWGMSLHEYQVRPSIFPFSLSDHPVTVEVWGKPDLYKEYEESRTCQSDWKWPVLRPFTAAIPLIMPAPSRRFNIPRYSAPVKQLFRHQPAVMLAHSQQAQTDDQRDTENGLLCSQISSPPTPTGLVK